MGIKSLNKFIKDTFPEIFEEIHISEYAYEKITVDSSLYIHHFKALAQERWLLAFMYFVGRIRCNDVHCIFVFDKKENKPVEKSDEIIERKEKRDKYEADIMLKEEALRKYIEHGEIDQILIEFQKRHDIQTKNLLVPDEDVNVQAVQYKLNEMKKHLIRVTKEDFDNMRTFLDIMNVQYFDGEVEAETTCADLCIQDKAKAVLTEDTDVLAYGVPVMLSKFNTKEGTCRRVVLQKLLDVMGFTKEQFLDFCIMCGTDYNDNIPRVGPKKAYQLLKQHGSIDALSKFMDVSILKHKRVRELFTDYKKCDRKLGYCGIPDFETVKFFAEEKGVSIDMKKYEGNFKKDIRIVE